MGNTILPFDELMKAVLEQLKSQKYMDSTLTVYRRTYKRIHIFLNHHGTDIYTHELGKAFLADSNVSKPTFVAYSCAVRRLDNYIDRNLTGAIMVIITSRSLWCLQTL